MATQHSGYAHPLAAVTTLITHAYHLISSPYLTRWKLSTPNTNVMCNILSQLLSQQQIRDTVQDGWQAGGLEPQDRWKIKSHA